MVISPKKGLRLVHKSQPALVRKGILEKIEDMEDVYLAEHVLDRIHKGEEKTLSAEETWRGLED